MVGEVEALIEWAYDLEQRLWSQLDCLKEDLFSEEQTVREAAEEKAGELLSWLLPPLAAEQLAESRAKSVRRLEEMLRAQGFPESKCGRLAKRLAPSNRGRGRPRERGLEAIRALSIYLREDKTWREIGLEISGTCRDRKCHLFCPVCEDVRRENEPGRLERHHATRRRCPKCRFPIRSAAQKQQICFRCVDQVRKLAEEAKAFLEQEGVSLMPRRASITPGGN
jgi:hypothetical protein